MKARREGEGGAERVLHTGSSCNSLSSRLDMDMHADYSRQTDPPSPPPPFSSQTGRQAGKVGAPAQASSPAPTSTTAARSTPVSRDALAMCNVEAARCCEKSRGVSVNFEGF